MHPILKYLHDNWPRTWPKVGKHDIPTPSSSRQPHNRKAKKQRSPRRFGRPNIPPPKPLYTSIAVNALNAYRTQHNLGPIMLNTALNAACQAHCEDMADGNFMAREGANGSTPGERAALHGYLFRIIGENVAAGQDSWEQAFDGWQKSPPIMRLY